MFENFPYSNFHDLNTDWIVKKIKDVETSEANAKASEEAAAESATAAALSADQAHVSEVTAQASADSADQSANAAAASAGEAQNVVADTLNQVNFLQSRVDNIIPEGTQTEGNTELLDIRVEYDGTIASSAGNAVRNQITNIENIISGVMNLQSVEPQWFVNKRYIYNNDVVRTGDQYAFLISGFLQFDSGYVVVKSETGILDFNVYGRDTQTNIGSWSDSVKMLPGDYNLNVRKKDGTLLTTTDLSDIQMYTSGFDFYETSHIELTESSRLSKYQEYALNREVLISGDNTGMVEQYSQYRHVFIKKAFYCKKDCTVWVGRNDSFYIDMFINGVYQERIAQGNFYKIPKNTLFVLAMGNTQSTVTFNNVLLIIDGVPITTDETGSSQLIANPSSYSTGPDNACSFMIGNKIYSISDSGYYNVIQGETVIEDRIPLDVSAGHANSCNYDNGYVYVSDWDTPNLIHVYSVDDVNNRLMHVKDIDVPIGDTAGSTQYYVFDDEKQIFSLGWKTGNSLTNPNCLSLSLWVKYGDTYINSWNKEILRPTVIQSMTVQNGYIYYVNCNNSSGSYHTLSINRINLSTGETEYSKVNLVGDILNREGEGIIPVDKQIFIVTSNSGRVYLAYFIND